MSEWKQGQGTAERPRARYAAVVVLELLPAWLARPREERNRIASGVGKILERYEDVSFRWFDADVLGHGYTDFVLCEFSDLERYQFLWEEIRDTDFFTVPYASLKHVMLGCEEGFRRFEEIAAA